MISTGKPVAAPPTHQLSSQGPATLTRAGQWTPDQKVEGRLITNTVVNSLFICLRFIIRVDYGPENISGKLQTWAAKRGIGIFCIQPGKPQHCDPPAIGSRAVTRPMSNATTVPFAKNGSGNLSGAHWRRCATTPPNGYGHTTINAPIWASAELPPP
jgi:hypothetical protein